MNLKKLKEIFGNRASNVAVLNNDTNLLKIFLEEITVNRDFSVYKKEEKKPYSDHTVNPWTLYDKTSVDDRYDEFYKRYVSKKYIEINDYIDETIDEDFEDETESDLEQLIREHLKYGQKSNNYAKTISKKQYQVVVDEERTKEKREEYLHHTIKVIKQLLDDGIVLIRYSKKNGTVELISEKEIEEKLVINKDREILFTEEFSYALILHHYRSAAQLLHCFFSRIYSDFKLTNSENHIALYTKDTHIDLNQKPGLRDRLSFVKHALENNRNNDMEKLSIYSYVIYLNEQTYKDNMLLLKLYKGLEIEKIEAPIGNEKYLHTGDFHTSSTTLYSLKSMLFDGYRDKVISRLESLSSMYENCEKYQILIPDVLEQDI